MPIKRAAFKALRKSKTKHFKNVSTRTEIKTLTKNYESLLAAKKTDEAKKILTGLVSKIDRAASKGILKKNNASRKISRLMKKLSKSSKA